MRPETFSRLNTVEQFQVRFSQYALNFARQEGLCFYCRTPMALPDPTDPTNHLRPDRVTREHLIPKTFARNSKTKRRHNKDRSTATGLYPLSKQTRVAIFSADNIVAACNACNREKGSNVHWRDFMIMKIQELWAPD